MTMERMIALLEIERECVARECDRNCADCELVQEQDELLEMYTELIALCEAVKKQKAAPAGVLIREPASVFGKYRYPILDDMTNPYEER